MVAAFGYLALRAMGYGRDDTVLHTAVAGERGRMAMASMIGSARSLYAEWQTRRADRRERRLAAESQERGDILTRLAPRPAMPRGGRDGTGQRIEPKLTRDDRRPILDPDPEVEDRHGGGRLRRGRRRYRGNRRGGRRGSGPSRQPQYQAHQAGQEDQEGHAAGLPLRRLQRVRTAAADAAGRAQATGQARRNSPTRRWNRMPACSKACSRISASRARSSRSAPVRSSPSTNSNPRPASSRRASSASPTTSPAR